MDLNDKSVLPELTDEEVNTFKKLAEFDDAKLKMWQERLKTATEEVEYWTKKSACSQDIRGRLNVIGRI